MRCIKIPLVQTGQMHKLSADYLSAKPDLNNLYSFKPSLEGMAEAIEKRKTYPVNREILVDTLVKQYAGYFENGANSEVEATIQSLSSENTFTVTTGHQLNIFTGPLYYVQKQISIIKYAQVLKAQFRDYHFVPIFWMASEDHDFAEINHFHIWSKTLTWDEKADGAVGRMNPHSLSPIIDEIEKLVGNDENGRSLVDIFKKGYLEHKNMADATRYIMNALFSKYGLVTLDADDANLKKAMIPVFEKDIFENQFFKAVQESNSILEKHYKLPVSPREINVFYLGENTRNRIVFEDGKYIANETSKSWSEAELKKELQEHPENFSPNVVLRPIYQEIILPNLTYIGGNNEIAYWLQLKNAFKEANAFYPQLLIRDSALFISQKIMKYLDAFKLKPEDMLLSLDDLKFKYYEVNMLEHAAEKDAGALLLQYEALKSDMQSLSSDLVANIVKQMNLHVKEVKRWKSDIHNKQLEQQETYVAKLEKIYGILYPDSEFQERHDNFIPYYLQYGAGFFDMLLEEFNPLEEVCHIFVEG